jgi:hypothetical protein
LPRSASALGEALAEPSSHGTVARADGLREITVNNDGKDFVLTEYVSPESCERRDPGRRIGALRGPREASGPLRASDVKTPAEVVEKHRRP